MPEFKMSSSNPAITIVILTLNEAGRLPKCIGAVPPGYPIVVVDSGSSDNTVEIAKKSGCRVIHNSWPGFAEQRNFALEKGEIDTKWVLFVDADEMYPVEFFRWFEQSARDSDDFDVGQVASVLLFRGAPLKHAPGYPIYHPRLVRRGHAHFVLNHTGHGEASNIEARLRFIDIPYIHDWFDGDLVAWFLKHVKLAALECNHFPPPTSRVTARGKRSVTLRHPLLRIPARFLYHFIWRGGFRDGSHGLEYALMYTWFEFTKGMIGRSTKNGVQA
jgi:glycosyltransferase involved in cell wall biosynthesis